MAAEEAQRWLTPTAALEVLSARFPKQADGKEALVQYAASGLIRARCENGIIRQGPFGIETSITDRRVNAEFWTAFSDRKKRVTENWTVAVFAADGVVSPKSLFDTYFARLLGVEFDEAQVRSLARVPAPSPVPLPSLRATTARAAAISEIEFWNWLPPGLALQRLIDGGLKQNIAMPAIMNRVSNGDIRIAAKRFEVARGNLKEDIAFALIQVRDFAPSSVDAVFWELGDLKYEIGRKGNRPSDKYICTGIRCHNQNRMTKIRFTTICIG